MKKYLALVLTAALFAACKKQKEVFPQLSSVNVVNAWVGAPSFYAEFGSPIYFSKEPQIGFAASTRFTLTPGANVLTLTNQADTTQSFAKYTLNTKTSGVYSFFLCGQGSTPDTLKTTDIFPLYKMSDTLTGVRVINLVPDSKTIAVDIAGQPPFVTDLAYKQASPFISIPTTDALITNGYNLEIRDATTHTVLATYSLFAGIGRCQTLVVTGQESGAIAPLTAFQVNAY